MKRDGDIASLYRKHEAKRKAAAAAAAATSNHSPNSIVPVVEQQTRERYIGFINPKVAIDYNIQKWSDEDLRLYKKRLTFSLRCIKFLLHQGLAFRGHDESKESSNMYLN